MDTVPMHALVWKHQSEDAKKNDELFEKLRKITEIEVAAADLASAY